MREFIIDEQKINVIVNSLQEVQSKYAYPVYKILESLSEKKDDNEASE